jgi:hypothetical protein
VEPSQLVLGRERQAGWLADTTARGVEILWGSDLVGVLLRLQVRGDSLVGTAETFHDFHGPPDVHMPAVAVRVTCRDWRSPSGGKRGVAADVVRHAS